jgi:glycosyltransferase involved in cell wall biosynthesis
MMSKVLVATHEFVRRSMAGPAIRAYELSRQLHWSGHAVRLAVPVSTDLGQQPFEIVAYNPTIPNDLRTAAVGQDVLVASCGILPQNPVLREAIPSIVVDLYDPFHLENLASAAMDPAGGAFADWDVVITSLDEQLRIGDFFLCASERQRDHWIGALAALNRVNPATFRQDPSLRCLIDVVSFGVAEDPPRPTGPAMRGAIPGIGRDDFVLLWNGGIYNWFDPLTLIESVAMLAERRTDLRLVFLSTSHPNPTVPQMVMSTRARQRAEALGLIGRYVFFNEDWVPYDQRANWLLEADVGVSTHYEHAETRYSYRTRVLDCFWAGLPVICTANDSLADLIEREDLGLTVPPEDVAALASAIEALAADPARRVRLAGHCRAMARTLRWNRVAEPLIRFCAAPRRAPDLAARPLGVAVAVPLVGDTDRLRRMAQQAGEVPASGQNSGRRLDVVLCVTDRGNNFMRELAEYLAATLRYAGGTVNVQEGGPLPVTDGVIPIIVAPHEYCLLDPFFQNADQDALLRQAAVVNTEQPGTPWFELAVSYCMRAAVVFDINEDGVSALRERGIEARHFPLGYHIGIDRWGGSEEGVRPIDVVFMGDINDRRSDLLAQFAHVLARHRFRLFPTDSSTPIRAEGEHFLLGHAKAHLLRQTKILLDIHRGPGAYFAWQRILPALANGTVVVTEQSTGYGPLRPFEHFLMAPYQLLPYYVEALLVDDRCRREIAQKAYAFVTGMMTAGTILPRVRSPLETLGRRAAAWTLPTHVREASASQRPSDIAPVPSRVVPSRVVPPRVSPAPESTFDQSALLKHVFLAGRCLTRRVEELERYGAGGGIGRPEPPVVCSTPAWPEGPGDVTVVVPVFDHETYVDECLESVLASVGVLPEVIVIDDASSDASAERVRRFMTRHRDLPLQLVSLPVNCGLPAARNEGFRRARSEYVFLLDIDNVLYPRGLARLLEALHSSDAGFAYGIIESFGEVRGLVSCRPWDVSQLMRGNYIDAMSMIRKSTWERVGGYVQSHPDTEVLYGWEDYDFWLGCAERGLRGEFVAEILARYRSRRHSMISITNLEKETTVARLRARHPSLNWEGA